MNVLDRIFDVPDARTSHMHPSSVGSKVETECTLVVPEFSLGRFCWFRGRKHDFGHCRRQGLGRVWRSCMVCGVSRVAWINGPEGMGPR